MALKRHNKTHRRSAVVAGAFASLVIAVCITAGIGVSLAGAGSPNADGFGFGNSAARKTSSASLAQGMVKESSALQTSHLTTSAERDISRGIEMIEAKEEADRIAAEEAAKAKEAERIAAAEKAQRETVAPSSVGLSTVDWSVGESAFIAEWTSRINAYLSGSVLAGYGETFARAAWENGVDPRWSPAISCTESTKGAACFLPHNAWGWGSKGFPSWEVAINTHVAGLKKNYGYTISYAYAQKYCPPDCDNWYRTTLSEMGKI